MKAKVLHERALGLAKRYMESERELLAVLMEMQKKRAFLELGYTGVFTYCLQALKLSESQAHYFSSVAKKSLEVPELKKAIDDGRLNLSRARRIAPVITVGPSRHEMRLSISEATRKKLERAKDLLKTSSLEDVLDQVLDVYLEKKDPIRKAERATFLRKVKPAAKGTSAQVKHEVTRRDQGRCQICGTSRYTELHHKIPLSQGGAHTPQNLITLCWAHHRMWHRHGLWLGQGEKVGASGLGRVKAAARVPARLGGKAPLEATQAMNVAGAPNAGPA